ncbi:MAG: deoxyguanosinetriphosphate triphosphohydrolase, partial [Pontiellaceae bacterium]|nr:deoxyguanosinetriphosphate triphosphohydrolase [Pontiellaceae bacterium]MBN2784025.1 deoxyguanosinetriphosphate triphosphohydrolase [Pontiellaceae bacterium]
MEKRMNWSVLLNANRLGKPDAEREISSERSGFHRDYDRIAFSHPFRRLNDKTQVHPFSPNDHIHSRLTHSLEVSVVGRSLGMAVGEHLSGLPEGIGPTDLGQILQAACLMHDLGNPPFGHAGEDAIQQWFSDAGNRSFIEDLTPDERLDFQCFEGNAQAFRLVANLENNPGKGGMQLTYATLATLMKYPWTSSLAGPKKKFCAFQSEKELLRDVAEKTGLLSLDDGRYCRHPLAFLAEAADDICYRIIDLEDAVEIGVLPFETVRDVFSAIGKASTDDALTPRRQLARLRARAINESIRSVARVFVENESALLAGEIPYRQDLISMCDEDVRAPLDAAKDLAKERVYTDSRKMELQIGGYALLGNLLELFCSAVQERISCEKVSYQCE